MSALADYYRAQAGNFDAEALRAAAQTRNINEETGQVAADSEAKRAALAASTFLATQQGKFFGPTSQSEIDQRKAATAGQNLSNQTIIPDALSKINLQGLQGSVLDVQAHGLGANGLGIGRAYFDNQGLKGNTEPTPGTAAAAAATPSTVTTVYAPGYGPDYFKRPGNSVGFAKGGVVGKNKAKPAKVDTVPAMLQPGEAVINKHAVEHYGPGFIGHMNKMGMMRKKAQKELDGHVKALLKASEKKGKRKAA